MEGLAEPGTICLTAQTAALVGSDAKLRSRGPLPVKGSAEPVPVFVLDGVVPRRRGLARWPGRSPLVGRETEAAVLRSALARVADGTAQIVGVVGEAGVGKSRLCEEFAQECHAQGITVRRAAGLAHAQTVAMLPIVELFRDFFGISDGDDPAVARQKVTDWLLRLDPAFEESVALLCDFLEVPDPDRPLPPLLPEVRHRRLFELLRQASRRRSEHEVAVLLLEDLHWWDQESDNFLAGLVSLYLGTRTLLVCNFRPEYEAAWMRHSWYTRLALAPLSPGATGSLVRSLIGTDPTTADLAAQVGDLTGGNPFHVEEVLRTLVEDGTLEGESGRYRQTHPGSSLRVPASVQATVAARIDRLDPPDKDLLQTAAVIGRDIPRAVLAAVVGREPDDLEAGLNSLCDAEFLMETQAAPAAEYRFWHPLTAEVAYSSLLGERRARLHTAVAEALAEPDSRADEQATLIALHYERAGDRLGAARWEERAANRNIYRDLPQVSARLGRVLELIEGLPEEGEALAIGVRARCTLARTEMRRGRASVMRTSILEEVSRLAEKADDDAILYFVRTSQGTIALLQGDIRACGRAWFDTLPLAERLGDEVLRSTALMLRAIVTTYVGRVGDGIEYARAVEAFAAGDADLGIRSVGTSSLIRSVHWAGENLALAGCLIEARLEAGRAVRWPTTPWRQKPGSGPSPCSGGSVPWPATGRKPCCPCSPRPSPTPRTRATRPPSPSSSKVSRPRNCRPGGPTRPRRSASGGWSTYAPMGLRCLRSPAC